MITPEFPYKLAAELACRGPDDVRELVHYSSQARDRIRELEGEVAMLRQSNRQLAAENLFLTSQFR